MRRREIIAAFLYPLFQVGLLTIGFGASWLLASGDDLMRSTVYTALAALLLSIPLARETAKLFLTPAELRALDEDE